MSRLPAYCVHKGRNLSYATIRGREHYLGRAHSPESHAAYREALAAFLAGDPCPPPGLGEPQPHSRWESLPRGGTWPRWASVGLAMECSLKVQP